MFFEILLTNKLCYWIEKEQKTNKQRKKQNKTKTLNKTTTKNWTDFINQHDERNGFLRYEEVS